MKNKVKLSAENVTAALFFLFAVLFPMLTDSYLVGNFSNFYITILVSLSLTLIWGFTGIFSFGQAAFYGLGAYTYAILSIKFGQGGMTLLALFIAVIVAALFAALLGFFIFYGKINNVFTGIITMCIATVLQIFMTQTSDGKWQILGVPLGGFNGINKIPILCIGNIELTDNAFYYLVIIVLALIFVMMKKIETSNFGYSLFGIRENQVRSELFGYNVAAIQTIAFSISGAMAGLAGGLFASWSGYVVPSNFSVASSTIAVVMVAVAGRKNITGAMVMTLLYSWFTQFLATTGSEYTQLILGALLIIVVLFIPQGVMAGLFEKIDTMLSHQGRKKTAADHERM